MERSAAGEGCGLKIADDVLMKHGFALTPHRERASSVSPAVDDGVLREALKPFAEAARWPIGATEIGPDHVVHCEVVKTGYPPVKVGSFGMKAADFVLALATYAALAQEQS